MRIAPKLERFRDWSVLCCKQDMVARFLRLFVIKSKFEAFLVIYALAVGCTQRGAAYLHEYPGVGGKLLFACCTVAVFMAGARILDSLEREQADG